jgi:D-galactarolactone isomerase
MKFTTGFKSPLAAVPDGAVDCHHHIFDSRYPATPGAVLRPADALVEDYRALQMRLGVRRHVIVQPSTYGLDNRLLIESIAIFGLAQCRGIAVVNTEVTDAELRELHSAGVRGIRFNFAPPGTTTMDMVMPLARRIEPLGWHIQINAPAAVLLAEPDLWGRLPVPCVFDHLARVPQPNSIHHPISQMLRQLLQTGRAYVKLSGFYNESEVGAPSYSDSVAMARLYASEAPERCLWGSDWPHPTERIDNMPDDANLLDCLALAVPDLARRQRILVDNPAKLYGFS